MRIIVIGAGSIGRRHFGNLQSLGADVTLVPWREFEPDRIHDGLDGVVIATATQIRLELITLCADAGLPFYVEKPLAYDSATLAAIERAATPVAARSMVGFMMRYHPAFRYLARMDLSDVYRFGFEIGHDVRQWRQNWSFAQSYAASPQGGGVLQDLCHELDMAHTLFPDALIGPVQSLGHADFPGVDFATTVALGAGGTVGMDYLSPVSIRRISLRGTRHTVDFDMVGARYLASGEVIDLPFDRNTMFVSAMSDFLALVGGQPVSDVEHLPRLDLVHSSCALLAQAWESRHFSGQVTGDYT